MLADGLDTEYKTSVSDVVSAADHAAEELITARLAEHRPATGWSARRAPAGPATAGPGTSTRSTGRTTSSPACPYWCSAVGLADEDGPLVGAVYFPPRDELWVGGRDAPTTLNGVPWPSWPTGRWPRSRSRPTSTPATSRERARLSSWQSVTAGAATVRMLGSASVDLAGVASGRLGIFLQANLNPWDWVPGAALVHRGRRGRRGVPDRRRALADRRQPSGGRRRGRRASRR